MMLWGVAAALVALAVPLSLAYGETISARGADSGINMLFEDGAPVSYSLAYPGGDAQSASPVVKERSYGYIMVDRDNGVVIILKKSGADYEVRIKVAAASGDVSRTLYTGEPPAPEAGAGAPAEPDAKPKPGQRDLHAETILDPGKEKEPADPADKQRAEMLANIEKALKEQREKDKAKQQKAARPDAVTDIEAYRNQTAASRTGASAPDVSSLELSVNLERSIKPSEKLAYTVQALAPDPADPSKKIGIEGVKIKAVMSGIGGEVDTKNGETVLNGYWAPDPYDVPGAEHRKKFVIEFTASHTANGTTVEKKARGAFYTSNGDEAANSGPIAVASATVTGYVGDESELVKAAITKYNLTDLAGTTHDGSKFVDTSGADVGDRLRELLKGTPHTADSAGKISWCQVASIMLDAGGSRDPNGDELLYKWVIDIPETDRPKLTEEYSSTSPTSVVKINDAASVKQVSFRLTVNDLEADSRQTEDGRAIVTIAPASSGTPVLCDSRT